jgi:osmotically-inducible protein OsmY
MRSDCRGRRRRHWRDGRRRQTDRRHYDGGPGYRGSANRIIRKFGDSHVNVTSYNRMVLLTGEVGSAAAKTEAGQVAQAVENVRGVFNEIQVAGNSSLTARANDSYLTSKVKARFVDSGKLNALHVKVVSESGVVYLMGMVKRQEAEVATELARTTGGVQKVVRVFEYLD